MLPVPVFVRAMIGHYAPASIYADGLHLRTPADGRPGECPQALSRFVEMFLTGEKTADVTNTDLQDLIDDGWGLLQDYACTGFGGATVVTPFAVASDPLPDPAPLPIPQSYYASGTIRLHLGSDGWTRDGSGHVTGIANAGSEGDRHDASATGTALSATGGLLSFTGGTTDVMAMASALDLQDRHLIFAAGMGSVSNGRRIFGALNADGATDSEISFRQSAGDTTLGVFSNASGSGVTTILTPYAATPSGIAIVELRLDGTSLSAWLNGTQIAADPDVPASFTNLHVQRIGAGFGGGAGFIGGLGDILAIRTGTADEAGAIAAARSYLARKYGVSLP